MRVFIVLCFLTSNFSYADSWFDKVKSGYKQVKASITESSEQTEPLVALPTSIPKDWYYSYFQEPVFDSKVAVLQVGLQHQESVVLVHGLGQLGMQDWYSVIPYLAQFYHVIAIDLPGFGYSEKPAGRYSPSNYAEVLHAITKVYAKESLTVIGHSMGGAVSLRFAAIAPTSIDKLILVDVAGILEKTAFVKHVGTLSIDESSMPSSLKNIVAQVNDVSGSLVEMTSINSISRFFESSGLTWQMVKGSANANAAISLIEEDFSDTLSKVNVDTRIIWGELDAVAPLRTAKVLNAQIPGAALYVIKGAGHVPMKSHVDDFQGLLALAMAPQQIKLAESSLSGFSDVININNVSCKNENNLIYSGAYNKVKLDNCSNIQLINVSANQLEVIDSLVNAENLTIHSNGSALIAVESVINITNGTIATKQPLILSGSRLDFAGVELLAEKSSIDVGVESKLVFSVSTIHEQFYQGSVHGAFKLREQSIAKLLNEQGKHVN